jgi:formate/nitrite transporter FocA (FNT family)
MADVREAEADQPSPDGGPPQDQGGSGQQRSRPRAGEIFARVKAEGREELERPALALLMSGVGAGLVMGLSALGVAVLTSLLGTGGAAQAIASLLYPIGFLAVILGRAQLFTENTLYPIVVVLEDREGVLATARLWALVLVANVAGAAVFAFVAARTSALLPPIREALLATGHEIAVRPGAGTFWSAVVGGWLIALVAWLVTSTTSTSAQFLATFALTYLVGVGTFAHSIASSTEVLAAVWAGRIGLGAYGAWLPLAVAGNIVGGVVAVSLLNYGQVAPEDPNRGGREPGRAG